MKAKLKECPMCLEAAKLAHAVQEYVGRVQVRNEFPSGPTVKRDRLRIALEQYWTAREAWNQRAETTKEGAHE